MAPVTESIQKSLSRFLSRYDLDGIRSKLDLVLVGNLDLDRAWRPTILIGDRLVLTRRLALIFLKDDQGRRPVYGGTPKFQEDPHWRDLLLFYEYLHGDNGAGLRASHQTGWTGVIARVMHLFATSTAEEVLRLGEEAVSAETESEWGAQLTRRS